jgi:hypothetical protein
MFLNKNTSISEPTKKLVKSELLILKWYQLDVQNIKCPFSRVGET